MGILEQYGGVSYLGTDEIGSVFDVEPDGFANQHTDEHVSRLEIAIAALADRQLLAPEHPTVVVPALTLSFEALKQFMSQSMSARQLEVLAEFDDTDNDIPLVDEDSSDEHRTWMAHQFYKGATWLPRKIRLAAHLAWIDRYLEQTGEEAAKQ